MSKTSVNKRKRRNGRSTSHGMSINARLLMIGFLMLAAMAIIWTSGNVKGCSGNMGTESSTSFDSLGYVVTNPALQEKILYYKGMTVSFNPEAHIPNWVAWELTGTETQGEEPRAQSFTADEDVDGCADPWDYSYSGYDRGHMAPAGDMKWDADAMRESFYMTNVCPQVKSLNTGTWKRLETKCRTWARADSAIYIICGPILTDSLKETIGDTRVVVPKRFFKVILSPYANPPRGIGFIMNNGYVKGGMQQAAVSIDEVEAVTGHDFFSTLPDAVENEVESQCRFHNWSVIK
ncbi:DNA/RNA non-specific endonuclease [uncultured Muribaculum sp.]|uniref:DNA/RNA non-specific endonuclease n=1 Tax=uncultured Muribaculum sp. TaxID=1918613 RepID=UPI0025CE1504|nr:DNA/RNA non-specific endonuclease [uncultured Muribaculum sp.]